jgi:predicted permease
MRELRFKDVGFDGLIGLSSDPVKVTDRELSERLDAEFVTPNYFSMLGVHAAAGRLFEEEDDGPNPAVAVISHDLWTTRFGSRADTIGRWIEVDQTRVQIIGVSEAGFSGLSLTDPRDMQMPASMSNRLSHGDGLEVVGRLREGLSEEQVLARLNPVAQEVERQAGLRVSDKDNFRLEDGSQGLESGKEEFRRPILVLALLVGVVLLVACANLTALLLVRSVERSQEAGMRVALGASRLALFRQFFVESLMLAVIGGTAAWAFALVLVRVLAGYLTAQIPTMSAQVQPDATVFAFSAIITLVAAFLFGTWPALKASRTPPLPVVQETAANPRRGPRVSRGIVAAQVALSLALLFCAGLFTRSLANLRSIDLGFRPENLIFLQPRLNDTAHAGSGTLPFFQQLLRGAEGLPNVRAASLGVINPLSGSTLAFSLSVPEYSIPGGPPATALIHYISSGYFRTMGIPLLAGADFPREATPVDANSVIVNQEFARKYLSGNAIGKTFSAGQSELRVIGVVGVTKYSTLREEAQPIFYRLVGGDIVPTLLQVRTDGDPQQGIAQLRSLLQAMDPNVPINSLFTMEAQIDEVLGRERLLAFLSTLLGSVAVGLSAIGLYGVLAFSVIRRTREIGVRIAVGATRANVVSMVLQEGGWLVGAGVLLGLPLAFACGRAAESLLYDLRPLDTTTLAGATSILLTFAATAVLIPAWRAARVNVVRALRRE